MLWLCSFKVIMGTIQLIYCILPLSFQRLCHKIKIILISGIFLWHAKRHVILNDAGRLEAKCFITANSSLISVNRRAKSHFVPVARSCTMSLKYLDVWKPAR